MLYVVVTKPEELFCHPFSLRYFIFHYFLRRCATDRDGARLNSPFVPLSPTGRPNRLFMHLMHSSRRRRKRTSRIMGTRKGTDVCRPCGGRRDCVRRTHWPVQVQQRCAYKFN